MAMAERPRLQRDLGDKDLMLLWNHGTLAEAFMRMYFLERACSMQVAPLSALAGRAPKQVMDGIPEKTAAQGNHPELARAMALNLAWPALKRKLDRPDPGFRN
jgi:ribulose-5-phosphate 4-epimerase/fuculose-1-phosphate aldolase